MDKAELILFLQITKDRVNDLRGFLWPRKIIKWFIIDRKQAARSRNLERSQKVGDELDGPRGRIYMIKDMIENNK